MLFTDTHTHLYASELMPDIEQVVQRAKDTQVTRFFLPNIDSESIEPMLALEKLFPDNMFCMMGLHPCSVKEDYREHLDLVKFWLEKRKFVAVGEIGIDLYWDKSFENEQKKAFSYQIELALQHQLPIVIHTRNSFDETYAIVKSMNKPGLKGIFHCFSGDLKQAEQIINLGGFKLGIGGVVTFKNSKLDEVLSSVNLSHIVLETDSPYLAPVPHRGKRNESAYIIQIAERLSHIYGVSVDEIAAITTQNSKEIFSV